MKATKVREMTAEELQKREQDLREELFRLRFQHVTGQLENPVRMRLLRRELAQAVTIRREKEIAGMKTTTTGNEKAG
jgi:large subunit ribosomal protein L29